MIKPISIVIPYKRDGDDVLLWTQTRISNDQLAGFLEFPGGKIEALESPLEAAVREVKEETKVQLKETELLKFKNFINAKGIMLMVFLYLDEQSKFQESGYLELQDLLDQANKIPPANKEILLDLQRYFS